MEQSFQNSTMNLGNVTGGQYVAPNPNQLSGINQQYTASIPAQPVGNVSSIPNVGVQPSVSPAQEVIPPVFQQPAQSSIYSDSNVGNNVVVNTTPNVSQPQPDLSKPENAYLNPESVDSAPVVNTVNSQQSTETQQASSSEPIIRSNYAIPVENFRKMIKTVKLAANCNKNIPLSQVIEIRLTSEGLVAKGTDMLNTLTYLDNSIKFTSELNIAIEIGTLEKLVDKLDDGVDLEILPDAEKGIITLLCDGGEFTFQQMNDDQTFQPLHIPDITAPANTEPVIIDFNELRDKLSRARIFASTSNLIKSLSGVCLSDRIFGTDTNNAYSEPNIPQISNETFCLASDTLKIISSLDFGETTYISFSKDASGIIQSVHIYSEHIKLDSNVDEQQDRFPLETVRELMTTKYDIAIKIPRLAVLKVLDRATIFLDNAIDEDCSSFDVSVGNLKISSRNGRAKLNIAIEGVQSPLPVFDLNIKKTIEALSNLEEDTVTLSINNGQQSVVCLSSKDIIEMISIQTNINA